MWKKGKGKERKKRKERKREERRGKGREGKGKERKEKEKKRRGCSQMFALGHIFLQGTGESYHHATACI